MTREEHDARAMLLGMTYFPRGGYYSKGRPFSLNVPRHRVDALTLEPLTNDETIYRNDTYYKRPSWETSQSWYPHDES